MSRILLDVDGVIADCDTQVWKAAKRLFKRKFPPPASWRHYEFPQALGLSRNEGQFFMKQLEKEDRLGWSIGFYNGAQSFTEHLSMEGHEVVFCTAPWRGMCHWVEARYGLLEHFLGRQRYSIVFTHDKHLVDGDWLIDDKWENLAKTPERGILFAHLRNEQHHQYANHVVRNYADILKVIKK